MCAYLVVIEREGRGWGAYCPDLPGVGVIGETRADVVQKASEAVVLHVEALCAAGEPIPSPSAVGSIRVTVGS